MRSLLYVLITLVSLCAALPASSTLLFGSCNRLHQPTPIWDLARNRTDASVAAWIWAGDNVYADHRHPCVELLAGHPDCYDVPCDFLSRLRRCTDNLLTDRFLPANESRLRTMYKRLIHESGFGQTLLPRLRSLQVPVLATWDDHDYGLNNGDHNYLHKDASQAAFLDMLEVPLDSERRSQAGVYSHEMITHSGHTISVILLDARFHRTDSDYLGAAQWRWLQQRLEDSRHAQLTLIVSGIQVLPTSRLKQEAWRDAPAARARLLEMVLRSNATAPLFLSGDVHFGELNAAVCSSPDGSRAVLPEATSSGITHAWAGPVGAAPAVLSWPLRLYLWLLPQEYSYGQYLEAQFGAVSADWAKGEVTAEVVGHSGLVELAHTWRLDQLKQTGRPGPWVCEPVQGERPGAVLLLHGCVGILARGVLSGLLVCVGAVVRRLIGVCGQAPKAKLH